jgi:hypothetical protein
MVGDFHHGLRVGFAYGIMFYVLNRCTRIFLLLLLRANSLCHHGWNGHLPNALFKFLDDR